MDGGMILELTLRRLIKNRDVDAVQGMATAFQHAIGDENCKKLAELLSEEDEEQQD